MTTAQSHKISAMITHNHVQGLHLWQAIQAQVAEDTTVASRIVWQ